MITAEGGEASVFQADVTNKEDCQAMAAAAVERYGKLDILDNNVGVLLRDKLTEIDPDDWDRVMAINLRSMMLASQAAVPRMIDVGRRHHHKHIVGGRHEGVERRRVHDLEGGHIRSYPDTGQ